MTQFCSVNAEVIPQCSWLGSVLLSQWLHKPFLQTTTLTHHINDMLVRQGEFKMDSTLEGLVRHMYYRERQIHPEYWEICHFSLRGPLVRGMPWHPLQSKQQIAISCIPYHKVESSDTCYAPLSSGGNRVPHGCNVLALTLHEKLPTLSRAYNRKRLCCRSRLGYNQLSLGLYYLAHLIVLEMSEVGKMQRWVYSKLQEKDHNTGLWGSGERSCHLEQRITHFWKISSWHYTWTLVETECLTIGHQVTMHLEMSFRSWILFDPQSQKVSNNPL